MAKIPDGCVMTARQILKSDVWTKKPAWYYKIWSYILIQVNHSDNKFFKRGENFFTYEHIYQNCFLHLEGLKAKSVDNAIRWLRATTQITTRRTTRGIVINVSKYGFFQDLKNYKNDTENDTTNDSLTTDLRHTNDTINKNDKNVKECKEVTPIQELVLAYKQQKGHDINDKAWDKAYFGRFSKTARTMLDLFGQDLSLCISCLKEKSKELEDKKLDWTFETILKHAADWKVKKTHVEPTGAEHPFWDKGV